MIQITPFLKSNKTKKTRQKFLTKKPVTPENMSVTNFTNCKI